MQNLKTITFETEGKTGILTLNRPQVLNAISPEVYLEIKTIMEQVENMPEIHSVIITGAGDKAFCAGADIDVMKNMTPYEIRKFASYGVNAFQSISLSPKPVIAAVNGLALGGGCELALACDLVVASYKARFGFPEISLGIIPGGGGTQRLTRMVGPHKAKELIFTGKIIKAEEAFHIGMINMVVKDELYKAVRELADSINDKGPIALHMAKVTINKNQEVPMQAGLDYEIECLSSLFATQDQKEGMRAFLEKRKPNFKGQ